MMTPGNIAPPPTAPTPAADAKSKGRGLLVAFFVILLLIAGGVIAFLVAGNGSGSGAKATIDVCRIDADGALTASGRLSGGEGTVKLTVEFQDTTTNKRVDGGRAMVDVGSGAPAKWSVTGKAGDEVQRVTCTVTDVSS